MTSLTICINDKFCDIRSEIQTTNIPSLGFQDIRECVTLWRLIYGVWGVTGWTRKHFNIDRLCPNVSQDTAIHLSARAWKGDRGRSSIFTLSDMTSCIHSNRIQFQTDHSLSNIHVQNHGRVIGARNTYSSICPFKSDLLHSLLLHSIQI